MFDYALKTQQVRHFFYEPDSFVPLLQLQATGWGAQQKDRKLAWYQCDHLGTPQEMTDEDGQVVWQAHYQAFGQADIQVQQMDNPLRFQGQYFDRTTGLHYNRHRYYAPMLGRYMSKDPIGLKGGLNLYQYVEGNPLSYVDPAGLDATVCLYPGAGGFGHVGIGVNSSTTEGFYPHSGAPLEIPIGVPGTVKSDTKSPLSCKDISTTAEQDAKMLKAIADRKSNPGNYALGTRNCAGFVNNVLGQGGISTDYSNRPIPFFNSLPGASTK